MLNMKTAAAGLASAFRDTLCQGKGRGSSRRSSVRVSPAQGPPLIPTGQYKWQWSLCSAATVTAELGCLGEGCAEGCISASGRTTAWGAGPSSGSTQRGGTAEPPSPRSALAAHAGRRGRDKDRLYRLPYL